MNYTIYTDTGEKYVTLFGMEQNKLIMPFDLMQNDLKKAVLSTIDYNATASDVKIRYEGLKPICTAKIHTADGDYLLDTTDETTPLKPIEPEEKTESLEKLFEPAKEEVPMAPRLEFARKDNEPNTSTDEASEKNSTEPETEVVVLRPTKRKSRIVPVRDNGTSLNESSEVHVVSPVHLPEGSMYLNKTNLNDQESVRNNDAETKQVEPELEEEPTMPEEVTPELTEELATSEEVTPDIAEEPAIPEDVAEEVESAEKELSTPVESSQDRESLIQLAEEAQDYPCNPIFLQYITEYSMSRVDMNYVATHGDNYCKESGWKEIDGVYIIDDVQNARRCIHSDSLDINESVPYSEVVKYNVNKSNP